jgi:hypothetical protein
MLVVLPVRSRIRHQLTLPPASFDQKPDAKFIFERLYLLTQSRLSHVQQLGGVRKMKVLSQSDETAKVSKFQGSFAFLAGQS